MKFFLETIIEYRVKVPIDAFYFIKRNKYWQPFENIRLTVYTVYQATLVKPFFAVELY